MINSLHGKVAIITGAAGGQGRVAAELFAKAGASVMLTDIDDGGRAIAAAIGRGSTFLQHDVADPVDWERVASTARARFGGVDILVNNAGVAGHETVESLEPSGLRDYLDINMMGAFHGIRSIAPLMRSRGGGAIINIGSLAALRGWPGLAGYGISKWALRGLSHYAARDLATGNIRVNLVLPGSVSVMMVKGAEAAADKAALASEIPLGRLATAEDVAQTVLFLASDAARYLTGTEITIDGGTTA